MDSWLTLIKIALTRYNSIKDHVSFSEELKQIIDLVSAGLYNDIKLQIALLKSIHLNDGYFNLFGNEFNVFIQPVISPSLKHRLESKCTSPFCPEPIVVNDLSSIPSIDVQADMSVQDQLTQWFSSENTSLCRRRMQKATKCMVYTYWDLNVERG